MRRYFDNVKLRYILFIVTISDINPKALCSTNIIKNKSISKSSKRNMDSIHYGNDNSSDSSTSYINLPDTLYEDPETYRMEKLRYTRLNPNAAPFIPIKNLSREESTSKSGGKSVRSCDSKSNKNIETHSTSDVATSTSDVATSTSDVDTFWKKQNKSYKITPFFDEMQKIAGMSGVKVRWEPEDFQDYVIISYNTLYPKNILLSKFTYCIAIYNSSGERTDIFHPYLSKKLIYGNYWNSYELASIVDPNYTSINELRMYFYNLFKNDKLIVTFDIRNLFKILKIKTSRDKLRDLSYLSRFDFLEDSTVKSFQEMASHFFPLEENAIKSAKPMLYAMKALYMRRLYEKLRKTWENEISFYLEVINTADDIGVRRFYHYFKDIYPGLQLLDDENPARGVFKPSPENFFGIDIIKKYNENQTNAITIYDSYSVEIFKGIMMSEGGDVREISPDVFQGPTDAIYRKVVEKLNGKKNGPRPTIVGYNIYEFLKEIDKSERILSGGRIYDANEIFAHTSLCDLCYKYLRIDFRNEELFGESDSRTYKICDEAILNRGLAAKISIRLFKVYSLDHHPMVEPFKL